MLETTNLMVFYENMLALNNVRIRCDQNQIVGIFGANSAGKSTLMYALSGIVLDIQKKEEMAGGERITVAGSVRYRDREVMHLSPSRRARLGIVLCPERRRIFKESTVLENLKIGGYLASAAQAKETLAYVFEVFPALYKLRNRIGGFLSGGEQQMLAIGMALVVKPELLLLDEPTAGMSPEERQRTRELIKKLWKAYDLTLVFIEHDMDMVFGIAQKVRVLQQGALLAEGTPDEIRNNKEVVTAYLGEA